MADKEPTKSPVPDDYDKRVQAGRVAFEESAREAAKKARAEQAQEEARLQLAAREAHKEGKKQRRASGVEFERDLTESSERKEFFRKMHKIGMYEFDKKDKLPDLKNKHRVILEGSTDANWFDLNKKRSPEWYQKIAEDAVRIKNLRGRINTNLDPQYQSRIDKLIDWVVDINNSSEKGRFEHEKWHTSLTGAGFSKEEIFGEHGLYNYVLAFRRAASEYESGKTVRRKLEEKDFKINKDGSAKFDSVKLNLGRTKKGPKHRTTVINGFETEKKGGRQTVMDDMIIRLWDKVEAAKMDIDFYGDFQIYIRKPGLTLAVVIITIKSNPKNPGTYIYVINGKTIENPDNAIKETHRLVDEFIAKEKAEKDAAYKSEQEQKIKAKTEKARTFLNNKDLEKTLKQTGFKITGINPGFVEFLDQGKKVHIDADFRIQRGNEDYLVKIDKATGRIIIKTAIIAVLDEEERTKYKKASEMGIFTLYDGEISDIPKFVKELNSLKDKANKREKKIIDVLKAQPNKINKST